MKCRICGNQSNNTTYVVREMMFGLKDSFRYFQCSRCRCLQIEDFPRDMSRYYPKNYYSFLSDPRSKYRSAVRGMLRRLRDHYTIFGRGLLGYAANRAFPHGKMSALSKANVTKRSKILDVGCGTGWRLYSLKEIGFENLLGIDPFLDDDIIYDNGLNILKKSIHDLREKFDLIMYNHSFEHIKDPHVELKAVFDLLHKGGECMIRVPTVSSYAWEHYREHWVQLDAPRHYFLHSAKSMELLAKFCGLDVRNVTYDSTKSQFQGSELYKRGIPMVSAKGNEKFFTRAQLRSWKNQADRLNSEKRGDQAVFYLMKH